MLLPAVTLALLLWLRRVVHEPQGQGAGGLPSLLVFGAPVTPTQLMLLAGAGLFMGLRGLLVGVIICEWLPAGFVCWGGR